MSVIKNKWQELSNDSMMFESIKNHANVLKDKGGVIWIKYMSKEPKTPFTWCFIERGSNGWKNMPTFANNFSHIEKVYDPEKHIY